MNLVSVIYLSSYSYNLNLVYSNMFLNKINIYYKHTFELDFFYIIAIILFKMVFFILKYILC